MTVERDIGRIPHGPHMLCNLCIFCNKFSLCSIALISSYYKEHLLVLIKTINYSLIFLLKVRQRIATGVESLVRIGLDKGHFCFRDHENTGRDIVLPGEVTFIE